MKLPVWVFVMAKSDGVRTLMLTVTLGAAA
jgi:hypothetical protein